MKPNKIKALIPAVMIAGFCLASLAGISQDRKLPDGTMVYGDGTRKLPNGTVIYKGGSVGNGTGNNGTSVTLPDGSVVLPDGSRTYPRDRDYKRRNGKGLPPGQAKKIYGGKAKDYAPGQQKKYKNKNKEWKDDNHKGKGKRHKD
jgi:hypothetical protein